MAEKSSVTAKRVELARRLFGSNASEFDKLESIFRDDIAGDIEI